MNKHRYPIWFADDDYKKLKFQTHSAILRDLISELEKDGIRNPLTDKLADMIMIRIERSWKKIRGRDIPL